MKKVFVDNGLFKTGNVKSGGLISGLKKLSEYSFTVYSGNIKSIDKTILGILDLENIVLKELKSACDYEILLLGKPSVKVLVIGKNGIINFKDAVNKIILQKRSSSVKRKTKETDIEINLELDGEGKGKIKTGIGFFDHMLEQIARHANLNLSVKVKGDLEIDEHHTIEDTGIALGEAIRKALGVKKGIKRYGYFIPMDEAAAVCAVDLGGRSYLNFNCKFNREFVGEMPTEMIKEFFRGLSSGMLANIYLNAKGENDHHKIESIFKVFAKSLNEACRIDERAGVSIPTTKGIL